MCLGLISIAELRAAVLATLVTIEDLGPFFEFADWHEHDGYIAEPRPLDIESLKADCQSDDLFVKWSPGDDFVRRAIVDEGSTILLRFYIDVDEFDVKTAHMQRSLSWPRMDFTGPPPLIDRVSTAIKAVTANIEVVPACDFFDTRHSG